VSRFDLSSDLDEDSVSYLGDDLDNDYSNDISDCSDELLEFQEEAWEEELRQVAAGEISERDIDILRAFALKVTDHLSTKTFAKLPFVFRRDAPPSWPETEAHAARLSGFKPVKYDCCVDSCALFVGPHANLRQCPKCQKERFNAQGKPRKQFTYLPLIPRLKTFIANLSMAQKMRYRSQEHKYNPNVVKDVFDSTVYQNLLDKRVPVNGELQSHTYFGDERDIALGLSTDGFAPFKRRKYTAWPLVAYNYNLPPELRFLKGFYLPLGVIPGPKKPDDFDSFLWPLVQELLLLESGLPAYDSIRKEVFMLRAFLILVFGDIPAISMLMRMKGHNGSVPCRFCTIPAVRGARTGTLYVPLDRSQYNDEQLEGLAQRTYDPLELPLRTHDQFMELAAHVQSAPSGAEANRRAKACGIKGIPILSRLSALSFPHSFPYEFMHLMFENVLKNLHLLWTTDFKGVNSGSECYQLTTEQWAAIWAASLTAHRTIPSVMGPGMPNSPPDAITWTADSRCFWSLYIAPIVLENRFPDPAVYDHFIELIELIIMCLDFDMPSSNIELIRKGFAEWVIRYEQ
jgi:hypothetical protein